MSRTAVSSHLRILRTAGLVAERRDGRYRLYSLEAGPVDEVMAFMAALYRRSLAELRLSIESSGHSGGRSRWAPTSSPTRMSRTT